MAPIINSIITSVAAVPCNATGGDFFGFPTWYKYLNVHSVTVGGSQNVCVVDFDFSKDIPLVAIAVVDILLRIGALVAIAYVIYGAIRYTTSQGDPQATGAARETIIGALVGLAIAIIAAGMVSFIGNKLGG